jgi:hypothetical protein
MRVYHAKNTRDEGSCGIFLCSYSFRQQNYHKNVTAWHGSSTTTTVVPEAKDQQQGDDIQLLSKKRHCKSCLCYLSSYIFLLNELETIIAATALTTWGGLSRLFNVYQHTFDTFFKNLTSKQPLVAFFEEVICPTKEREAFNITLR